MATFQEVSLSTYVIKTNMEIAPENDYIGFYNIWEAEKSFWGCLDLWIDNDVAERKTVIELSVWISGPFPGASKPCNAIRVECEATILIHLFTKTSVFIIV